MEGQRNTPPQDTPLQRVNQWAGQSVMVKMFTILLLSVLLLIPLHRVQNLIEERQDRKKAVVAEVSESWAGAVSLAAPALVVPYTRPGSTKSYSVTVLPERVHVEGELMPQERSRSLYKVILYSTSLILDGEFLIPDLSDELPKGAVPQWDEALLTFTLSDQNSIYTTPTITWRGTTLDFEPGQNRLVYRALHLPVPSGRDGVASVYQSNYEDAHGFETPLPGTLQAGQSIPFRMNLELKGSGELSFVPMGKETTVAISSPWPSPSFAGEYLPTTDPKVGKEGFAAEWSVSYLNRGFPQVAEDFANDYSLDKAVFGVRLMDPVEGYVQAKRSVKYGILVILLTFLGFFLMEVISKRRIHPFQYILVGVALVVFYSLLVALSEHISFGVAYLVAAVATVILVTFYISAVLRSAKLTLTQAFGLAATYSFIYVILRLEDYSLLAGSVGLFLLVALLMGLTRRVNWYSGLERGKAESSPAT